MRFLFLLSVLVAVAFFFYSTKMKPIEEPAPVVAPQPAELTVADLRRLASAINLDGLANTTGTAAGGTVTAFDAGSGLKAQARQMLQRPGSNLIKDWIRNYIRLVEHLEQNAAANHTIEVHKLQRDLRSLEHTHK